MDRPLTERRHWRRAEGRLVSVPLTAAGGDVSQATEAPGQAPIVVGRVVAAGDGGVTLEVAGERREFAYAELGPGQVQVEFGRPGEAGGDGTGPGNGGSQDGH